MAAKITLNFYKSMLKDIKWKVEWVEGDEIYPILAYEPNWS